MCNYCHNDASFEWVSDKVTINTCKMSICHLAAKYELDDNYDVYDID
jgi:hypothetical protein